MDELVDDTIVEDVQLLDNAQSELNLLSEQSVEDETNPYVVFILVLIVIALIIRNKMTNNAAPADPQNSTAKSKDSTPGPNTSPITARKDSTHDNTSVTREDMLNARLARFGIGMIPENSNLHFLCGRNKCASCCALSLVHLPMTFWMVKFLLCAAVIQAFIFVRSYARKRQFPDWLQGTWCITDTRNNDVADSGNASVDKFFD